MEVASRNAGPAVVTLGRYGDITAALPLAHELSYQIGCPVPFIVSKEFAPLLECAYYVEPVIYDQPFHKLAGAIRRFQHRYSKLHVAQCFLTDGPMEEPVENSFVKDAWARAGMLDKFGLPLVIDHRDKAREQKLSCWFDKAPFIVIHRGGISSPYPYRQELWNALRGFSGFILDITGMGCERPQDLLAILEWASVAILADSFPLHLSYACRDLPVIALQTDKPTNWFGAPPRINWVANFRYDESLSHMESILDTVQTHFKKTKRTHFSFPENVYNASVLDHNHKRLLTWRYHPKPNDWKTKLFGIKDGDRDITPIILPSSRDECSHEDARLFTHNGKPHLSYTLAKFVGKTPRCVVEYGELKIERRAWFVKKSFRVNHGRNDWSGTEKNHVFFSHEGKLYCLYGSSPVQVILEVDGEKVVREHLSSGQSWAHGSMSGDVIVPYFGKLLRIFHSRIYYLRTRWRYHIGAALMAAEPPFETLAVNPVPLFSGEDGPRKCFHSKPHVVFCCGAVVEGDDLLVTISRNDHSAEIVRLTRKQLGL